MDFAISPPGWYVYPVHAISTLLNHFLLFLSLILLATIMKITNPQVIKAAIKPSAIIKTLLSFETARSADEAAASHAAG
jgi:hypothetical protein